jgi:hypothetical protein
MARSWEYSPRRRVAMQVVMWVIFGFTLALASLVAQRQQIGPLQLGPPTRVGNLVVQIPWNWRASISQVNDSWLLRTSPMPNARSQFTGEVRVTQQLLPDASTDAQTYLANNVLGAVVPTTPIAFPGLRRQGIIAEYENTEENAESNSEPIPSGLYAVTIVPVGLGRSLAVGVIVLNPTPFAPDDYKLLRQLVQTVKLAPH